MSTIAYGAAVAAFQHARIIDLASRCEQIVTAIQEGD